MKKINPNLLKLAHLTHNLSLAEPKLEEKFEEEVVDTPEVKEIPGHIYVPSLKLYVAEERSLHGKNWYQTHEELHKADARMLTLKEFVEFLKYLKENPDKRNNKILDDIVAVRNPIRAERIDANFKTIKGKLHMHYLHEGIKGKLKPRYTEELKGYLAEKETSRIDLDYWLEHATSLGLPPQNNRSGVMYYWAALPDNNSVAGFVAGSGGGWPRLRQDSLRLVFRAWGTCSVAEN